MKNKKYFILTIVVAIIFPCILGGIYFISIYNQKNETAQYSSKNVKPEAIFKDTNILSGIDGVAIDEKNYLGTKYFEFKVVYPNGQKNIYKYNIGLKETAISDNIDLHNLHWKLLKYNYDTKEYDVIDGGDFSNLNNGNLIIGKDIEIGMNSIEQFRFYYYLVYNKNANNDYAGSTFDAKIYIE